MINLVHAGKVFEFYTSQYMFKVCFIYVEKMTNTVAEETEENESGALKTLRLKTGGAVLLCCALDWGDTVLWRVRAKDCWQLSHPTYDNRETNSSPRSRM